MSVLGLDSGYTFICLHLPPWCHPGPFIKKPTSPGLGLWLCQVLQPLHLCIHLHIKKISPHCRVNQGTLHKVPVPEAQSWSEGTRLGINTHQSDCPSHMVLSGNDSSTPKFIQVAHPLDHFKIGQEEDIPLLFQHLGHPLQYEAIPIIGRTLRNLLLSWLISLFVRLSA